MSENYDVAAHNKAATEAKPVPGTPAAVAEPEFKAVPVVEEKKEEDASYRGPDGLTRSERRRYNTALREASEFRGKVEMLERLIGEGRITPAAAAKGDDEPNRNDFTTDAEYAGAVGKWSARQEVKTATADSDQVKAVRSEINAAVEVQAETKKFIPDWSRIAEEAQDLDISDQPGLQLMFASSDMGALLTEYFVDNPEEWEKLIGLKRDGIAQRKLFHRLEGRMEIEYDKRKAAAEKKVEPVKETPTERDAKKAKPSESITPKGGTASDGKPAMFLNDGRTLNPAWKAERNAALGVRP